MMPEFSTNKKLPFNPKEFSPIEDLFAYRLLGFGNFLPKKKYRLCVTGKARIIVGNRKAGECVEFNVKNEIVEPIIIEGVVTPKNHGIVTSNIEVNQFILFLSNFRDFF